MARKKQRVALAARFSVYSPFSDILFCCHPQPSGTSRYLPIF
ncbi:unknown protein [Cronobacter turicensis z3032]|uniref:Uncharacterized protein n=1 Tax=Cronobacter turicensis (strain DSM 18703 / CCUG 55852 / LMG 23827 / z3032) TaxID=693216 RepID=C9XVN3_CROTZ|nr:unknown protein [Cronobacter turicensis z3032]